MENHGKPSKRSLPPLAAILVSEGIMRALIVGSLAALLGLQIYNSVAHAIDRRESKRRLERISETLREAEAFHRRLSHLDEAVSRIESSVAMDLTSEQEAELREIESMLDDRTRWPKDSEEADGLKKKLKNLIGSMSPRVQDEQLPQLLPNLWGVEALQILRGAEVPDAAASSDLVDSLSSILEREPEGGRFERLRDELKHLLDKTEAISSRLSREESIGRAKDALNGRGDLAAGLEGIEGIEGADAEALRRQLKERIASGIIDSKLSFLDATLARSLALDDERLRQAGVARVQDAAIGLLIDLETEKNLPKDRLEKVRELIARTQTTLDKIAHHQQEELASRVRQYQKWALEQVQKFNEWPYEKILEFVHRELKNLDTLDPNSDWQLLVSYPWSGGVIQRTIGVIMNDVTGARLSPEKQKAIRGNLTALAGTAWNNKIDEVIAYRAYRESMIAHLTPINVSLLDPPVAQLYQTAFSEGWKKLEGRPDQLEVAKAAALIPKKPLE